MISPIPGMYFISPLKPEAAGQRNSVSPQQMVTDCPKALSVCYSSISHIEHEESIRLSPIDILFVAKGKNGESNRG